MRKIYSINTNKKMISISYGSSTSSWKLWRWIELDLIFTIRDICINSSLNLLIKFSGSTRSTNFQGVLPWNISKMNTKSISVSTRIVTGCAMKRDIPFWVRKKFKGDKDYNMIRIPNGGKATVEQMLWFRRNQ